jgi:hypothetical protein
MSGRYIKQEPYVDNYGIYVPTNEYVPEGCASMYRCVMTKEMFVDAYNKWIKHSSYGFTGHDDADDWSED